MNYLKQSFGIDISKDNFSVKYGKIDNKLAISFQKGKTFKNDSKGIQSFVKWHKKFLLSGIETIFVMEATGVYYENLAYQLADQKKKVTVLLPNKAKAFANSLDTKSKTDDIDAMSICRMGLERKLPSWKAPDQEVRKLKVLTRERSSFQKKRTKALNQLHAYQHAYDTPKKTTTRLKQELKFIEKQVTAIEIDIDSIITANQELKATVDRITQVCGISTISVITVIAETNQFSLIRNVKQLVSYAGLDIQLNESGTIKKKSRISKKGNSHIRKALYMPALSAARSNKNLNMFYNKLIERKPAKKIGIIAVERKLLILIYSLWKSGQAYDPNYGKKISGNEEVLDSLSVKTMSEPTLAQN